MSMLGELLFFHGLKIAQLNDDIFISQDKYVNKMLKKFSMQDCKLVRIVMETSCHLRKYEKSPHVDETQYISMIGGLLYLTTSKLDIMHAICLVIGIQAHPKETHEKEVN